MLSQVFAQNDVVRFSKHCAKIIFVQKIQPSMFKAHASVYGTDERGIWNFRESTPQSPNCLLPDENRMTPEVSLHVLLSRELSQLQRNDPLEKPANSGRTNLSDSVRRIVNFPQDNRD